MWLRAIDQNGREIEWAPRAVFGMHDACMIGISREHAWVRDMKRQRVIVFDTGWEWAFAPLLDHDEFDVRTRMEDGLKHDLIGGECDGCFPYDDLLGGLLERNGNGYSRAVVGWLEMRPTIKKRFLPVLNRMMRGRQLANETRRKIRNILQTKEQSD